MNRKAIVAVGLIVGGLAACATENNNDEIRSNSDHVYRYTGHDFSSPGSDYVMNFIDETAHTTVRWAGGTDDITDYLDRLNVGDCYLNPLSEEVKEVPCPQDEQ